MTAAIVVNLTQEEREIINQYAEHFGISFSEAVRRILEQHVKEKCEI